jgi:hypothetical protein
MRGMLRTASLRFVCLHGCLSLLGAAATLGCAGSQAAAPGPAHAAAPAAPSVRPVPSDPLELLVGTPSAVAIANVAQLRASALFGRVRPLIERASCVSSEQLDALLASTTRAIVASRQAENPADRAQWLALLAGSYSEQDVERVLASVAQPSDAPLRESIGRFTLATRAQLGASLLEQRVLVLGSPAWVRSALDAIDHPSASFASSALWREQAPRVQCAEHMLCVLSAADGVAARPLQRALASAGAKGLGRQLGAADAALGLNAAAGVDVSTAARLQSPDAAASAVQQIKDLFWQAGLLIRLAGLPDVLNDARVQAAGEQLQLDLSVSEGDLAQYQERLEQLLVDDGRSCAAVAAP